MQRRQAGRKKANGQINRQKDRTIRLGQAGETDLKEDTKWTVIQEERQSDRQKGMVGSVCRLERRQKTDRHTDRRRHEKTSRKMNKYDRQNNSLPTCVVCG